MNAKVESTSDGLSFEKAFARLEQILETLNSSQASLEESLALYEEADKLMHLCTKKLTDAERKIEVLMKNRSNELQLGPDNRPLTQERDFA